MITDYIFGLWGRRRSIARNLEAEAKPHTCYWDTDQCFFKYPLSKKLVLICKCNKRITLTTF